MNSETRCWKNSRVFHHVFISYRHESTEYARAVRRLADLLVQSGLPVELDQIYVEKNPGGPDEGWPKWCADRAEQSACVLVVPSTGWFAAYNGTAEPRVGCGAATEAHLFRQHLYDEKQVNSRLRLVYVDSLSPDEVPLGRKACGVHLKCVRGSGFTHVRTGLRRNGHQIKSR